MSEMRGITLARSLEGRYHEPAHLTDITWVICEWGEMDLINFDGWLNVVRDEEYVCAERHIRY